MDWWLDDGDVKLAHGSALGVLAALPAASVQMCVTSPPFFNLRDYGVEGQLGLEATPEEYVERMVEVFREVRRVLRGDGTLWLEIGDSYAGSWGNQGRKPERGGQRPINGGMLTPVLDGRYPDKGSNTGAVPPGIKAKDLIGIPWRLAFALQVDGWYLRSDIVWSRPNPMPESVTDRPTKSHSYVFLLAKRPRYFYDADAIREPHARLWDERNGGSFAGSSWHSESQATGGGRQQGVDTPSLPHPAGRNARSVWEIATQPTPEAHFATYPEALVRRCILAGSSEAGECSACGAPWQRQVERTVANRRNGGRGLNADRADGGRACNADRESITTGWAASCGCGAPARPQTVLDPFVGSGTTALVARRHGRRSIGVDLNAEYLAIAARRTAQLSLLAEGPAA